MDNDTEETGRVAFLAPKTLIRDAKLEAVRNGDTLSAVLRFCLAVYAYGGDPSTTHAGAQHRGTE